MEGSDSWTRSVRGMRCSSICNTRCLVFNGTVPRLDLRPQEMFAFELCYWASRVPERKAKPISFCGLVRATTACIVS